MKTTIWKSDFKAFPGLDAFVLFWEKELIEFKNFYIFIGNFNPYDLEYVKFGLSKN